MQEMKKYKRGYIAGVFDLFHIGHLNLIKNAKNMCEYLIVGILKDELVVHFKHNPPIIPDVERREIVSSLKDVDETVLVDFENIDKLRAWDLYHFDCLFSGNDWAGHPAWVRDKERLNKVESDIYFFDYTRSTSSTKIKGYLNEKDKLSQKILIYGAGEYGRRALEYYGRSNVIGFIDKDKGKIGTLIEDKPVLDIERIKSQLDYDHLIVVALKEDGETVEKKLKEITNSKIKCFI